MTVFSFAFSALIGYLCGALPIGFLLVKWTKKIDLREIGSGRTGGTNSFRAAGLPVGILTAITDVLKAACAIWLVRAVYSEALTTTWLPWVEIITGVMSVVGHNWSVFLGWGGGAGTGPNVGWAAAIWWPVAPIAAIVVAGILWLMGIASVASLAMAAVIPISFLALYLAGVNPYDHTFAYVIGGFLSASVVAWALRPNIKRLLEGQERVVGPRARRLKRQQGEA
jgi:glycerol-3-phosphate acyltransferase PlsY